MDACRSCECVVLCRLAIAILAVTIVNAGHARANIVVNVDKSSQRMTVSVDGHPRYSFVVSTGRAGYGTPTGVYHPHRLERVWFSKEYYSSPMPHSIFFHGGYAIHGSYEISRLGGPASHGCIRLHPADAAKLYALVQSEGMGKTTIVVSGQNPRTIRQPIETAATKAPEPRSWYRRSYGDRYGEQGYRDYPHNPGGSPYPYGRPAADFYGHPLSYQYGQPYPADPYAQRSRPEGRGWGWGPDSNY